MFINLCWYKTVFSFGDADSSMIEGFFIDRHNNKINVDISAIYIYRT